jgi:hypothetical protein
VLNQAGGPVLPFGLTVVVLSFVYSVFAPVRLTRAEALAAAGVAALLSAAMRPAFGLVLHYNPNFGYAFGSLKAIFLLIVWVYYTFAVLLFGAEVAANTRRREALVVRRYLLAGGALPAERSTLLDRYVRRLDAGAWLFREGEAGHELFMVLQGSLRLSRGGQALTVARPGDYFGEMSMLLDAPRSAGAEALEPDTQVMAVSESNFDLLLRENPALVRRMLKDMAERLSVANTRLTR